MNTAIHYEGGVFTTRLKYDVMLNDMFYATLTSVIPYRICEDDPSMKNINLHDIEMDVEKRLPTLKNKNYKIAFYGNK